MKVAYRTNTEHLIVTAETQTEALLLGRMVERLGKAKAQWASYDGQIQVTVELASLLSIFE